MVWFIKKKKKVAEFYYYVQVSCTKYLGILTGEYMFCLKISNSLFDFHPRILLLKFGQNGRKLHKGGLKLCNRLVLPYNTIWALRAQKS